MASRSSGSLYTELSGDYISARNPSENYLRTFLKSTLPPKEEQQIESQLRKLQHFPLFKSKHLKKPSAPQKKASVTRHEKQKLGLVKCPKGGWNYARLEELRQLWRGYMRQYLNFKGKVPSPRDREWASFSLLLGKADYHGAEMTVVRSKCSNRVGQHGTCVMDTKNTFVIVSPDNVCRTLPKNESVFKVRLDNMDLTIFGKLFSVKPGERNVKKIKTHSVFDL